MPRAEGGDMGVPVWDGLMVLEMSHMDGSCNYECISDILQNGLGRISCHGIKMWKIQIGLRIYIFEPQNRPG